MFWRTFKVSPTRLQFDTLNCTTVNLMFQDEVEIQVDSYSLATEYCSFRLTVHWSWEERSGEILTNGIAWTYLRFTLVSEILSILILRITDRQSIQWQIIGDLRMRLLRTWWKRRLTVILNMGYSSSLNLQNTYLSWLKIADRSGYPIFFIIIIFWRYRETTAYPWRSAGTPGWETLW